MPNDVTYEQLCTVLAAEEKRWQAADNTFGIPEEEYTFYKTPTPWAPTYLTLMWLTGGRCSEVACIRGRDINVIEQDGKEVALISLPNLKQRKTAVKECIVIPSQYPEAWARVEKYYDNLQNPMGLFFHRKRWAVWWQCKRLFGCGSHHVGRHSFVMNAARKNANIIDIQTRGGWKSISSMAPYIHAFGRKELIGRMMKGGG